MRSLAHIFRDIVHNHAHAETPLHSPDRDDQPHFVPIAAQAHGRTQNPSEQEVRDYLASLAKAYGLPTDFVHAVAQTENHFRQDNHENRPHRDKHGRWVPGTTDYGLM